jgi:hypothetical protein
MLDLGISLNTVKAVVQRMEDAGLLLRLLDGQYILPNPVSPLQEAAPPQSSAPKAKRARQPKPAAPPNRLYVEAIDLWHHHLLALNGVGYKPSNPQAQGVAMKGILDQFRQLIANKEGCPKADVTDAAILHAFGYLLGKWATLEPFHQKLDLTHLNKYLADILNTIKNGAITRKGQRPANNVGAILSALDHVD